MAGGERSASPGGGPYSRKRPTVNTLHGPAQMTVDGAMQSGKFVKYESERGDNLAFIFCQPGRLEKFCNDKWQHGAVTLTYTGGEGSIRDSFGFCGVPKVSGPEGLCKLMNALMLLCDEAGVSHNLASYQMVRDEWWSSNQVPTRGMPSAELPTRNEQVQPSGSLSTTYKQMLAAQADDDAVRGNNDEDYRAHHSPPRQKVKEASPADTTA